MKKINILNKIYNNALVVEEEQERRNTKIYYKCKCLNCETIFSAEGGLIRRNGAKCPKCGLKKNFKNIAGKRFGKLVAIKPTNLRQYGSVIWECKCDCGNIKNVCQNDLHTLAVQSCGCLNYSIGEHNIENILKQYNKKYIRQFSFKENIRRKYDFALIDDNKNPIRLIEFDGQQHYDSGPDAWYKRDSYQQRHQRDEEKNKIAKKNNIPLVRIPYWERDKITLEMIEGDKYEI